MKYLATAFLFLLLANTASFAQKTNEEDAIKATINLLFDGMRNSDTTMIRKAFADKNTMQTIAKTKDGKSAVKTESIDNFIKSIAKPHSEKYDERITFTKILVDANLASVWTDYKFYIGDKFSHCGVNSFQLFKDEEVWKIIYIIDTRRRDNCN